MLASKIVTAYSVNNGNDFQTIQKMEKAVVGFTNLADNKKLKLLNLLSLLQQKPGQLEI